MCEASSRTGRKKQEDGAGRTQRRDPGKAGRVLLHQAFQEYLRFQPRN